MQAARRFRYGTPDVVEMFEVDKPTPIGDEVLIRVIAASVNRADMDGITPRPSFIRLILGLRRPRNPAIGLDAAGIVDAVGPGVTRFKPGDRVFADLYPFGAGAFAEYACVPERAFLHIPDDLSFEDAASLPHSAVLAIQGLRLRSGRTVGQGDRVLIDGASGNVGPFAIQIAKSRGAIVTAVASGSKLEFVRSLGADHVIDYRAVDYATTGERYDWILDVDSHHQIRVARRALRPGGVYVTLGGGARRLLAALVLGPLLSRIGGKSSGLLLWWKPFMAEDVKAVTDLIAVGRLRTAIDRRYPLAEVREALRYVDDGKPQGKVIITMP